jgi:DNA repair protein RecO (recombination protein O)
MPILVSDSIILQVYPYGDTSKILRLLTASHGLRSVIARGALRPRSRFGGLLEPFATGVATFYVRDGRELQTLSAFELTHSNQALGSDLLRFGGASLVAELVLRTGSEEPQPRLFELLRTTLDRIRKADAAAIESEVLTGAWSIVSALGFTPDLAGCMDCGRDVTGDAEIRFDYVAGGIRCPDCAPGTPGKLLPAGARRSLLRFLAGESVSLERTEGHWRLLRLFLDHHVLEGGSLKSLAFVMDTLERRCAG